jgi:hypothetical protein
VVKAIADEYGLKSVLIDDEAENDDLARTDWVLVTRDPDFLAKTPIASASSAIGTIPGLRAWTDDYNNLFRILK